MPTIEELIGVQKKRNVEGSITVAGEKTHLGNESEREVQRAKKIALEAIQSGMIVIARITAVQDYGLLAVLERVSGGAFEDSFNPNPNPQNRKP